MDCNSGSVGSRLQGRSQDFSKGWGHTVLNIIVMAFSPRNIIGCFLKKRLTKGRSRAPQDPPSLRPWFGTQKYGRINGVPLYMLTSVKTWKI